MLFQRRQKNNTLVRRNSILVLKDSKNVCLFFLSPRNTATRSIINSQKKYKLDLDSETAKNFFLKWEKHITLIKGPGNLSISFSNIFQGMQANKAFCVQRQNSNTMVHHLSIHYLCAIKQQFICIYSLDVILLHQEVIYRYRSHKRETPTKSQ